MNFYIYSTKSIPPFYIVLLGYLGCFPFILIPMRRTLLLPVSETVLWYYKCFLCHSLIKWLKAFHSIFNLRLRVFVPERKLVASSYLNDKSCYSEIVELFYKQTLAKSYRPSEKRGNIPCSWLRVGNNNF